MTRKCTICVHPSRDQIDQALIAGQSYRDIAGQYSLSAASVQRHKDNHLPASMALATAAAEVAHGDNLLDQTKFLQSKALSILKKAEDAGDLRTALMANREARGNLELLARLLGELQENPTVNVLVVSPEWLSLRSVILTALDRFPTAKAAVVEALQHVG